MNKAIALTATIITGVLVWHLPQWLPALWATMVGLVIGGIYVFGIMLFWDDIFPPSASQPDMVFPPIEWDYGGGTYTPPRRARSSSTAIVLRQQPQRWRVLGGVKLLPPTQ